MRICFAVSMCLVCGIGCLPGTGFAHAVAARSRPQIVGTSVHVRANPPGASFRVKPMIPSGLVALGGTPPGGAYRSRSYPVAIGGFARPNGAAPAVFAETRINRKP